MATLQERLACGDKAAFAEFYDAYADRVSHYLLVRLNSRDDADDVLQDTFLRLARSKRKLAKVDDLGAYLFTIARHEAARLATKNAHRKQARELLAGNDLFRRTSDIDALENAETVTAALNDLSADLREIVELKTYAELTLQQISQVTGLPLGTVATRYRLALEKMRTWFARQR